MVVLWRDDTSDPFHFVPCSGVVVMLLGVLKVVVVLS